MSALSLRPALPRDPLFVWIYGPIGVPYDHRRVGGAHQEGAGGTLNRGVGSRLRARITPRSNMPALGTSLSGLAADLTFQGALATGCGFAPKKLASRPRRLPGAA